MPDWAQIISDALDILKFDGAVQDTLAELRGKWGAQVPALLDERFDAVGVQYMKLSHETLQIHRRNKYLCHARPDDEHH